MLVRSYLRGRERRDELIRMLIPFPLELALNA